MEASFHSEVCKHIGRSLHDTATLFLFAVQQTDVFILHL